MKLIFLALAFLFFSCKKDKSCESCGTERGFEDATIIDGGPVETDGCGWLIKIDNDTKYYHPDMLNDAFKQNQLAVKICYEQTTYKYLCGIGAMPLPVIRVLAIKK